LRLSPQIHTKTSSIQLHQSMMRIAILVAFMTIRCDAERMVRTKSSGQVVAKKLSTQQDMSTGFNGAEDVPTVQQTKGKAPLGVATKVKATHVKATMSYHGAVPKAGEGGPSFDKVDDSHDHSPNVIDSIPHNTDDSGSSIPMFLFLACGGSCVAWLYVSEQKRSEAKNKAGAMMQMMTPLVQDAMRAIGAAANMSSVAREAAANMGSTARQAAGLNGTSYQRVSSEDNDELLEEEPEEEDPYANPSAGMESAFVDDELEQVPDLMEQPPPPLDLFADNIVPPVSLDFTSGSEPQTLDSLGLLDTETSENNKFDLGF